MIKQQGITLIGAIFVLVIVSLLGQYLVTIAGVQRQTTLLTLQSARAYQAANAGIEWAIASISANHSCPATPPTSYSSLPSFSVTTSCNTLEVVNENNISSTIYQLTATSSFSSYDQVDYVSRTLQVVINDEI